MSKFIAIEGLDGAGKSTQIELLLNYLHQKGIKTQFVHFPRTQDKTVFGDLIAEFLRGEFGKINDVHPKLVALLFAEDRNEFSKTIKKWLKQGYYVIVDRYVLSNIAYQCAKLKTESEKEMLSQWILDFEFKYNKIPIPDFSLYLDVPFAFVENALTNTRKGEERSYLKGKTDIHEDSLSFQKAVKQEYDKLLQKNILLKPIACADNSGKMLDKTLIHQQILKIMEV